MADSNRLAVVIPAYKPDFLRATLESLVGQARNSFRVYVGDDASPAALQEICDSFSHLLDLAYFRFPTNLGQQSLVAHWNRCVRMTDEPWVWLFSDDDLMEPGCVAAVLDAIRTEGDRFELFHFGVTVIDAAGDVVLRQPDFPPVLSAHAFAGARLRFELASYAPDYVFARSAFDRIGGFVDFPLAWCSDDATWIAMAGRKGIRTLEGPRVRWRLSGQNISSHSNASVRRKFAALIAFLLWLDAYLLSDQESGHAHRAAVMAHSPSWLFRQMATMRGRFWPGPGWQVAWRLRRLPEHGVLRDLFRTVRFDLLRLMR
jgi:glycosyltransferase involved in cell wall biosynthesis